MTPFFRRDPRWRVVAVAAIAAGTGIVLASRFVSNAIVADIIIVGLIVGFLAITARINRPTRKLE